MGDRSVNDTPANETRARPCPHYDAMTNITWSCWNAATITNGSCGCMGVWDSCRDRFHTYLDDCMGTEETEATNVSNTSEGHRHNTSNNTSEDQRVPGHPPAQHTSELLRSALTEEFQSFLCQKISERCDPTTPDCHTPILAIAGIGSSVLGGPGLAASSSFGVKAGSLVGAGTAASSSLLKG